MIKTDTHVDPDSVDVTTDVIFCRVQCNDTSVHLRTDKYKAYISVKQLVRQHEYSVVYIIQ